MSTSLTIIKKGVFFEGHYILYYSNIESSTAIVLAGLFATSFEQPVK